MPLMMKSARLVCNEGMSSANGVSLQMIFTPRPFRKLVRKIDVEPDELVRRRIAILHGRVGRIDRQPQRARLLDRFRQFGGLRSCNGKESSETNGEPEACHISSFGPRPRLDASC